MNRYNSPDDNVDQDVCALAFTVRSGIASARTRKELTKGDRAVSSRPLLDATVSRQPKPKRSFARKLRKKILKFFRRLNLVRA